MSTPTHRRKPIWLRTGVEPIMSATKAVNMISPATQMMCPVCSSALTTACLGDAPAS